MPQPPGPPESFIFLAFSYSILRLNLSLKFATARGASAPRTPRIFHFPCIFLLHTEVYPRLKFCESVLCASFPDPRIPSFSFGISMIFLPILRSTLGSNSASSRCAPPPLTYEFLHFPMEFLAFSYSILRSTLGSNSASSRRAPPPGSLESFIS